MIAKWRSAQGWLARYGVRAALLCLAGAALVATGLLALPAIQQLSTLAGLLDLGAKLLVFIGAASGAGSLIAPRPEKQGSIEAHRHTIHVRVQPLLGAAAVALLAFGLATYLWWTRERILPTRIDAPVAVVVAGNENQSQWTAFQQVPTGDIEVTWEPPRPMTLDLYRDNRSVEKTTGFVLPGVGVRIAEPGRLEIKLWEPNGPVTAEAWLVVPGTTSARTTLTYVAWGLLLVALIIAARALKIQTNPRGGAS